MLRKTLLLLLLVLIFSCHTSLSRPLLEPNEIIKTLHDIDTLMNSSNGNDDDDEDREDDDDDSIVNPAVRDIINNSTKNATLSFNNASKTENVTAESISSNRTSRNSSTYSATRNSIVEKKSVYTKTENEKSMSKITTRDGGIGPGQRLTSEQQIPPPPPPPQPPKTDVDFHKGTQETKILNPTSLKLTEKKAANNGEQTPDQQENKHYAKSDIDDTGDLNDGNEESEESSTQHGEEAEVEGDSEQQLLEQSETRGLVEDEEDNSKPDKKEEINPEANVQEDNAITNGNVYKSVSDDNNEEPESNNQKGALLYSNSIENEVRDVSEDSDNNDKVKMFFISPFDKSEGSNDNSLKTRQILTYPASGNGHTVNHHWGPSHIWNSDYPYFAYGYSWGCGHHGYGPHILRQKKSSIKNNKKSSDLICRDYVLLPALTKTFLAVPIAQNGEFDQTGIARQIVSKDIACNDNDPVCTQKQVIGSMAGGSLFGDGMGGLGMGFPGIPGLHTGISGYNEGGGFGNGQHRDGESSYVESSHHLPSSGHGSIVRGGFGLQGMHGGYHGHHGRDSMATLESMRPISQFINKVYQHGPNIWSDKSTNPEAKSAKADKKAIVKNTKKSSKRFFHFPGLGYSLMDTNGFSGGASGNIFGGSFGGFGYPTAYPAQSAVIAPLVSPNNIYDELNGWGSKYINQGSSFAGWGKNFVGPIAPPGTVEEGDGQIGGGALTLGSGVVRISGGLGNTGRMDGAAFTGETNALDRPSVVGSVNGGLLRGVDLVGHGYKQLAHEFEGNGIGFPYVVRSDNIGNHGFSSYSVNGVAPSNLDVARHGNFAIKSKIKSKKKGKQKKKASVKGVARQDIAMPDEQALMDVTKQRQLIGSLGASTLFADNVGGIGLGHPGVPQMSSGISGIPGEYGGTGGYAHGWDGEGPGLNPHGYNDFGYNMGKEDHDYGQHERSNPAPRPEKTDEGQKREEIHHIKEIQATRDTADSAEAIENFIERPQPDALQEERRLEGVPAQKMSEIRKLVHEVSNSLARTNEKLKALKKYHTPMKDGEKRQITPAFTPVVSEPAAVPDIRYPVPSADRYPLGAGYIWPSANYGHQYGGPYAWSKSHTPAQNKKSKSSKRQEEAYFKRKERGKVKRSTLEKNHEKSRTGTKRQFLEHPSMGYSRRQYPYHGGMPIYGYGMGIPIHGGFGGHSGGYSASYGGGFGHRHVLMEGSHPFRISGGELAGSHSLGGYGGGGLGSLGGYGSGFSHSLRPIRFVSNHGFASFSGSHGGLSAGYGGDTGTIIGGHGGLSVLDGGYNHGGISHIASGGYTPGEAIYHGENSFVPTLGGIGGYSGHSGMGGGIVENPNGGTIEHTGGHFSGYNNFAPINGFSGRHSSFNGLGGPGEITGTVGGSLSNMGGMGAGNIPGEVGGVSPGGSMGAPSVGGISGMTSASAVAGYGGHSEGFESEGLPGFGRQNIAQEEPEPSQASQYMGMSRSQMPEQMQSMIPESQQALFAPQQGMQPYGSEIRQMEYPGSKKSEVPKLKNKTEKKSN